MQIALPKPIETEVEKYECFVNYLIDKNILDSSFKNSERSELTEEECDLFIDIFRNQTINDMLIKAIELLPNEEDEETQYFKNIIQNKECLL